MSYYLTNLVLVLFIIYFCKTNRKGLHIFQLEHYYRDRYLKWLKDNSAQTFNFNNIILLCISSILLVLTTIISTFVLIFSTPVSAPS